MLGVDWNLTLLIAFPIWIALNVFLERRPRLIAYLSQPASFAGGGEGTPGQVVTHSLIVANLGRGEAFNVRLSHHILPQFKFLFPKKFTVSPAFEYEVTATAAGGADIVLPVLAPQQQIMITYLYEPPLTAAQIHGEIKSNAGAARLVSTVPLAEYPWWLAFLGVQVLEIIGVIALVYFFLNAARAILA